MSGAWLTSWAVNNIAYNIIFSFLIQNALNILVALGIVVLLLHSAVQISFTVCWSICQSQRKNLPISFWKITWKERVWICNNSSSFYAKELLTKQVRPVTKLTKGSLGREKKKKKKKKNINYRGQMQYSQKTNETGKEKRENIGKELFEFHWWMRCQDEY